MPETKLEHLIDPEVMGRVIDGRIEKDIRVLPFATLDTTLQGRPGSTITVPKFGYIGDAVTLKEGEQIPTRGLEMDTAEYTVMKIGQAVSLSDESVLSGLGNPVGQATRQIANSIRAKTDDLAMKALLKAPTTFDAFEALSYTSIVKAIDVFQEEDNNEKVIFVHPRQVTHLRLDPLFISADTYTGRVTLTGEIGMIANTRIVVTKRVPMERLRFVNPIVALETNETTDDTTAALTYYMKRDTLMETARDPGVSTKLVATKHFVVALTNEEKVVRLQTLPMI